MKTTTTRFGAIEFEDKDLLTFPTGIIGFANSTRFVILDQGDAPFKWLQSVDEPELAFVIMDPVRLKTDYRIEVAVEDIPELDAEDESDLTVFVFLTIPPGDSGGITANLRGPVVLNHRTRRAKQIILADDLPTQYLVFTHLFSLSR